MTVKRNWNPNVIQFKTTQAEAKKKLERAMERLGAIELDYGQTFGNNDSMAWVQFRYKGQIYRFEYSRTKAAYYNKSVPDEKDLMIAIIYAIQDLAKIAERGVFDFGLLIQGFKHLTFIELPSWAAFMGFTAMPISFEQVSARYKWLVKGSMSPEKNATDFHNLRTAYDVAKQFFGVKEAGIR